MSVRLSPTLPWVVALMAWPGALNLAHVPPTVNQDEPVRATTYAAVAALQQESAIGPEEVFRRQCVACHGPEGKGDGPAARALKPRPSNLADPEVLGALTDEAILDVLTNGRGSMPSFGELLEPEKLRALVGYLRELSGTPNQP